MPKKLSIEKTQHNQTTTITLRLNKMKANGVEIIFNIKLWLLKQERKILEYQLAHFKKKFHPATGQEQFFEAGLNVCQVLLPITIACTPDSEINLHQISEFAREAVRIHINHKFKFGIKSSCWHLYHWYVLIDKIEPADPFGSMQQEAWHPWEGQAPC